MDFPTPTFWTQWGGVIVAAMVVGLLVFAIRQVSALYTAKLAARAAGGGTDAGYRQLAEELSAAFKQSEAQRQADAAAIAEMRQRLGAIETLLRQVE